MVAVIQGASDWTLLAQATPLEINEWPFDEDLIMTMRDLLKKAHKMYELKLQQ